MVMGCAVGGASGPRPLHGLGRWGGGVGNQLISALVPKMPAQPPRNPRTTSRATSFWTPKRFEKLLVVPEILKMHKILKICMVLGCGVGAPVLPEVLKMREMPKICMLLGCGVGALVARELLKMHDIPRISHLWDVRWERQNY